MNTQGRCSVLVTVSVILKNSCHELQNLTVWLPVFAISVVHKGAVQGHNYPPPLQIKRKVIGNSESKGGSQKPKEASKQYDW